MHIGTVLAAAWILASVFDTFLVVKTWSSPVRAQRRLLLAAALPYRSDFSQALIRGSLPLDLTSVTGAVGILIITLQAHGRSETPAAAKALIYVAMTTMMVFAVATLAVMYLNRPAFLVPPALRVEEGLLLSRRRRRSNG